MSNKKVLIVGGTGYLGQHLLQGFTDIQESSNSYSIAFTYHSKPPPQSLLDAIPNALHFFLDFQTGDGFDAITQQFGQPDVVVNCAALSIPRTCELDPESAMAINVPSALVTWLSTFGEYSPLLIHLSTDQGTKSFYNEEDDTIPVNFYGKSKVAAEQFISTNYRNYTILRSSIIYGPQTVSPVPKSLPIQWIEGVLAKGEYVNFFHDEYRCPVYIKDLVTIILQMANKWISDGERRRLILNVGGPDRVSRVQMAEVVAEVGGYNNSLIKSVSASSVDRGVKSPSDISMDIARLIQIVGISPTSFADGVRLTLDSKT